MIDGRVLIPMDVFTALCVQLARASDHLLAAARLIQRAEAANKPFDTQVLDVLFAGNENISTIEQILKAVIEEHPAPKKPGSEGYSA